MIKIKNKMILSGIFLLLFLTSYTTSITQVNGLVDDNSDNELMISDFHYEDFSDESYKDPSTNAWGWGSGTITNTRDFSWELLDFYTTPYQVRGIDVQGRIVYVAQYNKTNAQYSVGCYNINNPSDIVLLSERHSLPSTQTIAVDGDVVYTGRDATSQSFNTYNTSDPSGLAVSAAYIDYISSDGSVTDIDPEGHLVYYTVYNSASARSLRIADAEDPNNMIAITPNWVSNKALGLEVEGHLAYIAASTDGFYILNVTVKDYPVELGHVTLPGNATDVILDGNRAYVACGTAGVAVIDISDPTTPETLSIYNTDGIASKLVLQGNTLFVADGFGGVCVLDVVNPYYFSFVTQYTLDYVWDVDLFGGILVVASNDGIRTFQISAGDGIADFSQSYYANAWDGLQAWDVRVLGDVAYVAGGPDGFYTLNIRDPSNPILLDHKPISSGSFRKLDVQGSFAHVITDSYYYIYNIQDPSNIETEIILGGNQLMDVCVRGPLVYISWQLGGYGVLNVTHPNLASWANELDEPHFGTNITALWVQGPHVYTVDDQAGGADQTFRIFQTLDLTNQVQTSSAPGTTGYFTDIKVDGNYAYTSDKNWLVVYDVTDPYNLLFRKDISIDASHIKSKGIWNFGPYIMNAAGADGVYLVNATDFDNCEATQYTGATSALQVTSYGDYTYVANRSSLVILRHFESAGDTYEPGIVLAQSTKINTASGVVITDATLTTDIWHHTLCSYEFYLSADGGNHWEAVVPNVLHAFSNTGEDLRWRVFLTGLRDRSDHIHSVSINYNYDTIPVVSEYSFLIVSSGYTILFIIISVAALSVFRKKKKSLKE